MPKFPHLLHVDARHEFGNGLGARFLLRWPAGSRGIDHLFWVVWIIARPLDL